MTDIPQSESLNRSMNLLVLIFYGLGTIIGAGIYVLIGEVAAESGYYMPLSFILAGLIALFTGLSYCELSSRYPQCAGVAVYVDKAWGQNKLSALCGWMIAFTGVVSAAAICNGFAGYLNVFVDLDASWSITLLCVALGIVALYGINLSAGTISVITVIEVSGLAYVVWICSGMEVIETQSSLTEGLLNFNMPGVVLGSFLAFYAYIGFEDMVNVVEEVKSPRLNLPRGIIISIVLATFCYVIVAVMVQRVSTPEFLAASNAPLADLVESGGRDAGFIAGISLLAVINGALVQIIMASRVLYGMARMHLAPAVLAGIYSRTKTPLLATLIITALVLIFALLLPLDSLARLTSAVMLTVFIIVNLALLHIKHHQFSSDASFRVPFWIPVLGAFSALCLLLYQIWNLL